MVKPDQLIGIEIPLVLASASPRRRELLSRLGFTFTTEVADIDEERVAADLPPEQYVRALALRKAQTVAARLEHKAWVIGADTIVVFNGAILNKPADKSNALQMLSALSAQTHTVYSGVAIVDASSGKDITEAQRTDVTFRRLEESEIKAYVAGGSPMDKAGAYGIQDDFGALFVREIHGCYYNVVGLPLELMYDMLKRMIGLHTPRSASNPVSS